ncbi:hypothetical protein COUCH_06425 [Couchioplanes caeruleus]|nr:hypothetical protein [Couchioplanes caeruleus]UQU65936.1 hypothetical protein COUCH_06425 [Couchioplanes caeruleus]
MTVSNHGSPTGAYGTCRRADYDRRVGRTRGRRRREDRTARRARPEDEENDMAKKARKKKARKKSSANHGKRPNS